MTTTANHEPALMARARRAYELGRLRGALLRAALLALVSAAAGSVLVSSQAWAWAPLTFVLWTFAWWYGGGLLSSARYGLAAGAFTFLFPMSWLRPCCAAGQSMATCTMPEMCVLAGALVSLPFLSLGMRKGGPRRLETAVGLALGVLSLATLKCSALFAGEALGLLAGLGLGLAAASAVHTPAAHGA